MTTVTSRQPKDGLPAALSPIADLMSTFPASWALCGGWAIDAFLGRETREHGDIDVSVFASDQRALFEHLRGWQLMPHGPNVGEGNSDPWDGSRLDPPTHIHSRPDTGEALPSDGIATEELGFRVEFQIDDRDGDEWVLSRAPRVVVPVREAIVDSAWGVPVVAPHVLLFFKARELRRRDKLDFATTLPHLPHDERVWLRDAVERIGHPWRGELAATL